MFLDYDLLLSKTEFLTHAESTHLYTRYTHCTECALCMYLHRQWRKKKHSIWTGHVNQGTKNVIVYEQGLYSSFHMCNYCIVTLFIKIQLFLLLHRPNICKPRTDLLCKNIIASPLCA